MYYHLSNELLIETYEQANELQLSNSFIQLIENEINNRNFTVEEADSFNRNYIHYSKRQFARKA